MAKHLFKIYNYSIYVMWWWLSDPSPIIGKKLSLFKLWSQGFEVWGQDFEVKCGVWWLSVSVTVVWGRPNFTNRSQGREKQVLRKQCNNIIHDECNTLHCKHLYLTPTYLNNHMQNKYTSSRKVRKVSPVRSGWRSYCHKWYPWTIFFCWKI